MRLSSRRVTVTLEKVEGRRLYGVMALYPTIEGNDGCYHEAQGFRSSRVARRNGACVGLPSQVAPQARGPLGSAGPGVGGAVSGVESMRAVKTTLSTELGAQPRVASIGPRIAPARIAAERRIGMSFTVL